MKLILIVLCFFSFAHASEDLDIYDTQYMPTTGAERNYLKVPQKLFRAEKKVVNHGKLTKMIMERMDEQDERISKLEKRFGGQSN